MVAPRSAAPLCAARTCSGKRWGVHACASCAGPLASSRRQRAPARRGPLRRAQGVALRARACALWLGRSLRHPRPLPWRPRTRDRRSPRTRPQTSALPPRVRERARPHATVRAQTPCDGWARPRRPPGARRGRLIRRRWGLAPRPAAGCAARASPTPAGMASRPAHGCAGCGRPPRPRPRAFPERPSPIWNAAAPPT